MALIKFLRDLAPLGRWVAGIGTALFLLAVIGGVRSCQSAQNAKTETKLVTGQADAALKSGADAANTVGNVGARAAGTDRLTQENDNAIRQAEGAHAPVARPARDAVLLAVCKRAAYRREPKCMQFTPAK